MNTQNGERVAVRAKDIRGKVDAMANLLMKTAFAAAASGACVIATPAVAAPLTHETGNAVEMFEFAPAHSWQAETVEHKRHPKKRGHRHGHARYDDDYGYRNYDEPIYRNTRTWRGRDGRYYCQKSDGTTGLIIGGAVGALLGREIDKRGDRTLGTVIGAAGGALLGKELDSKRRCR